ncbi:MAG: OmpA family protein [Roseivivax sp.]|nr:OmpA family protein [Roseivivax sp.]
MLLARTWAALALAAALICGQGQPAAAQTIDPFEHGWTLDPANSEIRFLSVKKNSIAESSQFATFSGLISEDGTAQIRILMDSVDTKIDLRNVRMRFLFFETFKFPEATIVARIPADQVSDLHQVRRKIITMPFTLTLHGVSVDREAPVAVTLMSNDRIAVANTSPIVLALKDFSLEDGRTKLQEAAEVDILPFGFVSFDFVFDRASPGTPPPAALTQAVAAAPGAAALETKGNFDLEACLGRFEILSRTGNIYFRPASAQLDRDSIPLLDNLVDIVRRCPDLKVEVGGHTDSDGSDQTNKLLSERRAQSVVDYLTAQGIEVARLTAVGYGESQPAFPNDSAANKSRNRRIEFKASGL